MFGLYTTTSPRAAWWYATHGGIGEYVPKRERLTRRPGLTPSIKKFYVDGSKNFSGPIDSDLLFEVVNKRPDKWEFLGLDLYDDYDTFKDAWNDNIEARLAEDDWFVGNDTEAMPQDIAPLFSDPEIGREYLEKGGYESVSYYDAETNDVAPDSKTVVILTPKTAKSADPATYDDNGNLIPLSKRFNIQSDDIRFSPERPVHRRHTGELSKNDVILFADDPMRNQGYGSYVWELGQDLPEPPDEVVRFAAQYYDVDLDEARQLVDPENIVDSAGAWDDRGFVSDLWQAWEQGQIKTEPSGFKTQDGAVVIDRYSVKIDYLGEPDDIRFSPQRSLNNRGGAVYTTAEGHRAVQTSSRAGVRVYGPTGRRIGPVFQSVEAAERHLSQQ